MLPCRTILITHASLILPIATKKPNIMADLEFLVIANAKAGYLTKTPLHSSRR